MPVRECVLVKRGAVEPYPYTPADPSACHWRDVGRRHRSRLAVRPYALCACARAPSQPRLSRICNCVRAGRTSPPEVGDALPCLAQETSSPKQRRDGPGQARS
eukprot:scaffold2740_cov130-Isochrysis_galbana.AAC.1